VFTARNGGIPAYSLIRLLRACAVCTDDRQSSDADDYDSVSLVRQLLEQYPHVSSPSVGSGPAEAGLHDGPAEAGLHDGPADSPTVPPKPDATKEEREVLLLPDCRVTKDAGSSPVLTRHAMRLVMAAAGVTVILSAGVCGTTDASAGPSMTAGGVPQITSPPLDGDEITFGPGKHLVGAAIAAGRYFSDPVAGCYWERQAGTAGSAAQTIAFGFVGFDAAQWVVDIVPTDMAFESNAACGTWSNHPRPAPANIDAGRWLVGAQVSPGTYRSEATAGCYWERLRDFSGGAHSVAANDLIPAAGPAFVTILPGDAGFSADVRCGPWTHVSVGEPVPVAPRLWIVPGKP
jgi:hypothetical protein